MKIPISDPWAQQSAPTAPGTALPPGKYGPVIPTAIGGHVGPPRPAAYLGLSAQPSPAVEPVADLCELPAEPDSRLVLAGAPFFPGLAGGVVDPGQGDAAVAC
jgi:hypothetical protein